MTQCPLDFCSYFFRLLDDLTAAEERSVEEGNKNLVVKKKTAFHSDEASREEGWVV